MTMIDSPSYIKYSKRCTLKELNKFYADRGNFSYIVIVKSLKTALEFEAYLWGGGLQRKILDKVDWNHARRKIFLISVNPKYSTFSRVKTKYFYISNKRKNVYKDDFVDKICFKFVIVEKYKKPIFVQ